MRRLLFFSGTAFLLTVSAGALAQQKNCTEVNDLTGALAEYELQLWQNTSTQ